MPPSSLRKVPEMQLTSVLLPEPFGPIRPRRSPGSTMRSTLSSAVKPPKRLVIAEISSSGSLMANPPLAFPPPPGVDPAHDAIGRERHEHDQRHGDAIDRVGEVERGTRLDVGQVIRKGRAGHAHQRAAHRRGEELEPQRRHAGAFRGELVVAYRGEASS